MCNIVYRIAICDDDENFVRLLTQQVSEILLATAILHEVFCHFARWITDMINLIKQAAL